MIVEPHRNLFQSFQWVYWSQSCGTICQGKLRVGTKTTTKTTKNQPARQLGNSISLCKRLVMNTGVHTACRVAGAILAQHEPTEPKTPGCPQQLGPFYGHHMVPKNSCFFFELPEILGLEFSVGASSEFCLKKMKKLILTLVIFWFSKGTGNTTLCNFLLHCWRSFFPFPSEVITSITTALKPNHSSVCKLAVYISDCYKTQQRSFGGTMTEHLEDVVYPRDAFHHHH